MEFSPALESTRTAPLRAWYSASIEEFQRADPNAILGALAANGGFALLPTQRDTWIAEIDQLRPCLKEFSGQIFFEFSIPRVGRRIDVVLLIGPVVFAIEFKVGDKTFARAAVDQVWDYSLDLKNFHEASHAAWIVPILVATDAVVSGAIELYADDDHVFRPLTVNVEKLRYVIDTALERVSGAHIDSSIWSKAPYHPTPTIVEAARSLYAQHSVEAIARYRRANDLNGSLRCRNATCIASL